ncbi:MAG: ABC transporter ATP-binding protein [Rhodospirillaceae bacterium]|nr:ABC transporter ATP-binding protein [Rhodospirillales bacterium]
MLSTIRSFFRTVGTLPHTWSNVAITALAGLAEGMGLALFVPLFAHLDNQTGAAVGASLPVVGKFLPDLDFMVLLVLVLVLVIGSFALSLLRDRRLLRSKYDHIARSRSQLIEAVLGASWPHLSRQASGDLTNLVVVENQRLGNALTYQVHILGTTVQIVIYAILSAALSLPLTGALAVLAVVAAAAVGPFVRKSRRLGFQTNKTNREFGFHLVDYLKGTRLIKVTGAEGHMVTHLGRLARNISDVFVGAETNLALTNFLVQCIPVLAFGALFALAYAGLGLNGPVLITFFVILSRMGPRLIQLLQHFQAYVTNIPSLAPIEAALAECRANREALDNTAGHHFERLETGLTFEDVVLRYDADGAPALDGLSFTVGRNEMIGVVGGSGAGKSSLIDLVAALRRPTTGRVLVDGVPLDDMDLVSWRSRIGYVTQDIILFNGTVRENLLVGHPGASEQDIANALSLANLDAVIANLPQGLDTVVGESGVRLSGGQKQRLALARALVGNPQLLLLDEATSALDNDSERQVQDAIESIAHRLTIIVIAHRLSSVRKADRIHVMERGRILETGSFDELLAKGGRFAELHAVQFT